MCHHVMSRSTCSHQYPIFLHLNYLINLKSTVPSTVYLILFEFIFLRIYCSMSRFTVFVWFIDFFLLNALSSFFSYLVLFFEKLSWNLKRGKQDIITIIWIMPWKLSMVSPTITRITKKPKKTFYTLMMWLSKQSLKFSFLFGSPQIISRNPLSWLP